LFQKKRLHWLFAGNVINTFGLQICCNHKLKASNIFQRIITQQKNTFDIENAYKYEFPRTEQIS